MHEGLTYAEAQAISTDEMLLLLAQSQFRKGIEMYQKETDRLRNVQCQDDGQVAQIEKALAKVWRQTQALERDFYETV